MKLGYACINTTLPSRFKTCRLKTVEIEGIKKVKELSIHNLTEVLRVVRWNIENGIFFFRLSSELIPFASHPSVMWEWDKDEDIVALTNEIKHMGEQHNVRFSVHPGQYTVLNSPKEQVVMNSVAELAYHQKILDLIGGTDMILHVGGAYGDKVTAKERFVQNYDKLSEGIKAVLRIENDDKTYTALDVLELHERTGVPVCFDIHHHRCNHEEESDPEAILTRVFQSWPSGQTPKMHISSGRNAAVDPAHHDYILEEDFEAFVQMLGGRDVDIMCEAKMKEQAVLRLQQLYPEWQ
ncbi:UV DNA damage repair endonuclease UvsE [Pseudobacillus wudalianchiensis]|uniref:UV damage repair endonuclease UvsE n=1 Tax=Pseudobacillus wudalianchiensis TaxID=1743143 RepID=A0A1B9AG88_9BACI|nr:UV DNA damage repair endonuclease UvsE [Bacillus wudalianchiensis]OCA82835.1 UV damage repair endonuclease UvsE [Bacillus wudalianchiensis]